MKSLILLALWLKKINTMVFRRHKKRTDSDANMRKLNKKRIIDESQGIIEHIEDINSYVNSTNDASKFVITMVFSGHDVLVNHSLS